ncbi:MAG: 30S ribosomal protein S8 [Clostridiales bacterium]|nr:30S ribosomal protein S8 [Clostridiales bacterium]MCF8022399.1 30S ribosomal protein S8 [Clostridiales bacterium]
MSMTDPVADFLTRIRNGNMVFHNVVEAPASRTKNSIARILQEEGYVKDYEYIEDGKQGILRVYMKYGSHKERIITGIKRISKPGLRVYAKKYSIPKVLGGLGVAIVSTSQGVMTDKDARSKGIGGEVVCYVW